MQFTPSELKSRAISFCREHASDSDEKSQAQNFWRDFFGIFGLSPQRIGTFEARAKTLRGTVGFIDFFWPGTLLVEHKSLGRDLNEALKQALDYCSTGGLKDTELPRFIVVSDFQRFVLVELGASTRYEFSLAELHEKLHLFDFVLGRERRTYKDEDPVNIKAAELMGALHDELRRVGYEGHPLELFLVRLMFCFFADDTGIFQKDQFTDYLEARSREDGSDTGRIIDEMFHILDTSPEKRPKNLPDDLAALPYVNGQLFFERVDPPYFDVGLRDTLLQCARFNWGAVSPAIFGSLFQSVMNATERRSLGAHYTSEKNILKTVHGLFLDELQDEFERIKIRRTGPGDKTKLFRALLDRIAKIRFLDPACGCGNFLILSYRELRRLEISIHKEIRASNKDSGLDLDVGWEARGITVDHVYGIEIEEFPAQIARVALWIMDHLMNIELAEALGGYRPSIPLVTSPKIFHGNALTSDWRVIAKPEEITYILGNPPFVGGKMQSPEQRKDLADAVGHIKNFGTLDLVAAWYIKAVDFIQNTNIKVAFVSTNSITQGEQVSILWGPLLRQGVSIFFAHRTFKWTNEAKGNAAVFCVIIGFSMQSLANKVIYDYPDIKAEPVAKKVSQISPYLIDTPSGTLISRRKVPISQIAPSMGMGNQPIDGGYYLFTDIERQEFIQDEPGSVPFFRKWIGSDEFLNAKSRWVLWLGDLQPKELRSLPKCLERVELVKQFRLASRSKPTQDLSETPTRFNHENFPVSTYLVIPEVSSERRRYIPIGFVTPDIVASNLVKIVNDATLFHFGILQSEMHMAWMRQVAGRLKSDYRYSSGLVYNNFPWPKFGIDTDLQIYRLKLEACAQSILDVRAGYPESSLADLYDPLSMPPNLVQAHKELDKTVDKCYRKEPFKSELERVEFLFGLYEEYVALENQR